MCWLQELIWELGCLFAVKCGSFTLRWVHVGWCRGKLVPWLWAKENFFVVFFTLKLQYYWGLLKQWMCLIKILSLKRFLQLPNTGSCQWSRRQCCCCRGDADLASHSGIPTLEWSVLLFQGLSFLQEGRKPQNPSKIGTAFKTQFKRLGYVLCVYTWIKYFCLFVCFNVNLKTGVLY